MPHHRIKLYFFTINLVFFMGYNCLASTLEAVKKNKSLSCGVSQGLPGFSYPDQKARWSGLDVDYCRAVAAAIFGDPNRVKFVPLSAKERFTALQSKEVDLLSRTTTWTLTRDTSLGLNFAAITYYDGQGFMVPKKLQLKSAKELNGATICVNAGTTTELNVADYFIANGMKYSLITFEKSDEVLAAYDAGRCDVYTTDISSLYSNRIKLKDPKQHTILSELISKEPLGVAVRQGDDQWADLLRWVYMAMVQAEESQISSKNIHMVKKSSKDPLIQRLLGARQFNTGANLGLTKDWAFHVIMHVGNYGEVFERNLGKNTPFNMPRGINALWTKGGLHYALPLR